MENKRAQKKTLIQTNNTESIMEDEKITPDENREAKVQIKKKQEEPKEFRLSWFSKQLDKLAYFFKSSEMAFFITLMGVIGQAFHIYHVVFMISDLQGIGKTLNTVLWSVFFALGVLFFTLRSGTGNEVQNRKYNITINMFTIFEALINLYYWINKLVFAPAILIQYEGENGIDWAQVDWTSFQWSHVEWPSLVMAIPLAIAIPLILRAYAGEIRLMNYGRFVQLTSKKKNN